MHISASHSCFSARKKRVFYKHQAGALQQGRYKRKWPGWQFCCLVKRECGFTCSKLAVCMLVQLSFLHSCAKKSLCGKQPHLGSHDKIAEVGLFLQAFRVQCWNNQHLHGTENRQHGQRIGNPVLLSCPGIILWAAQTFGPGFTFSREALWSCVLNSLGTEGADG